MKRYVVIVDGESELRARGHGNVAGVGDVTRMSAFEADVVARSLAKKGAKVAVYAEVARMEPAEPTVMEVK